MAIENTVRRNLYFEPEAMAAIESLATSNKVSVSQAANDLIMAGVKARAGIAPPTGAAVIAPRDLDGIRTQLDHIHIEAAVGRLLVYTLLACLAEGRQSEATAAESKALDTVKRAKTKGTMARLGLVP